MGDPSCEEVGSEPPSHYVCHCLMAPQLECEVGGLIQSKTQPGWIPLPLQVEGKRGKKVAKGHFCPTPRKGALGRLHRSPEPRRDCSPWGTHLRPPRGMLAWS